MAAGLGSIGIDTADCHSAAFHFDSAAISACEKGQQWQQALSLLAVMHQTFALPEVTSYSAVISACEKDQRWQQALGLLELMLQTRVLPGVISCSSVISASEKGQR